MSKGDKGVDVMILAEDKRHEMLLYRHLLSRGYTRHKIRICPWFPKYQTQGLPFVRAEYELQVQALRDKAHRVNAALLVMVDADDETVEQRLQELDALLFAADKPRRADEENIAIVVARRNVETWFFFLDGNAVDEETDYKTRCRAFKNGEFALKFANLSWPRGELPPDCPPSLRHACEIELLRLP